MSKTGASLGSANLTLMVLLKDDGILAMFRKPHRANPETPRLTVKRHVGPKGTRLVHRHPTMVVLSVVAVGGAVKF